MRLPIDTSSLTFLALGPPEPWMDFETKTQKSDPDGRALFAVNVVAASEGSGEVISVKTPEAGKGVTGAVAVRVSNLVATPWTMGERSGVSYRAASIDVASAKAA